MFIGSFEQWEVGKRQVARFEVEGVNYDNQPFFVIREVTVEEWQAGIAENGYNYDPRIVADIVAGKKGKCYFYEISID